ncbi:hypothetical protein TRFO_22608 [Tritrichomonas foetus]|uniref:Uncharacterized protein n=1 Tax=Tritrichomonas foetus TaxID=1144522 RepID=A0A1J4KC29_9EUKA|nr:hypothetical protein TRFO_22608 [Tritrichomonas foetus]|eukprot:OHT08779.1 hypothetical protein TRFO_22608 [Tritrichomonas foetus]
MSIMKRQIVSNRDNITISKSWEGTLEFVKMTGATKLTIRSSKVSGKIRIEPIIELNGNEVPIPFSAEKWITDIESFLRILKIHEPPNGYTLDDIVMDEEGRLNIDKSLYRSKQQIEDYQTLVDYPLENVACSTKYPNLVLSKAAIIGIAVSVSIVVGAGVVAALVIFFIIKRKKSGDHDSAKDDQIETQTGTTEDITTNI